MTAKVQMENWNLIESTLDAKPIIIRILEGFKDSDLMPDYHYQIGIAIPLHQPNDHGFPLDSESKILNDIEDKLDNELGKEDAVLTAVITTNGMREFVYYTKHWEPEKFEKLTYRVESKIDKYELQFIMQDDPDRSVIKQLLET